MSPPNEHDVLPLTGDKSEEKSLVLAFKAGDQRVYDEIYGRYHARVTGICRRMLVDPHDVQEASQEAFLRVYQALGRFNGRYELGAWIARITTNVCLDILRGRSRRPNTVAPIEALDLEMDHEALDTPESVTIRRSEGRRVRKVLMSLPPMHRAAIVLRDFEGLSYGEIAGALHITEAQVKALLHRARQRFKRDWSSIASIFVPMRLLQRLKGVHPQGMEQAAAYGGSSTPQLATTCSAIVQSCGQFIAERVAPTVAAIAMVAGTGAVAASHEPAKVEVTTTDSSVGNLPARSKAKGLSRAHKLATKEKVRRAAPAAQPTPEGSPTPELSPSADPTPTEDESADTPQEDDHNGPPSGGSGEPMGPPPFSPALGFGTARAAPARSNWALVDCAATSLRQNVDASISYGEKVFPASLGVDADSDDVELDLLVYPDGEWGADVEYSGAGALSAISRSDTRLLLEYSGTYENTDAPDAEWKELPESGTFHITLELDCTASSVITETLQLSTG